jgi:hypothetical protein
VIAGEQDSGFGKRNTGSVVIDVGFLGDRTRWNTKLPAHDGAQRLGRSQAGGSYGSIEL